MITDAQTRQFLERGGMTGKEEKFINISEVVLVLVNSQRAGLCFFKKGCIKF